MEKFDEILLKMHESKDEKLDEQTLKAGSDEFKEYFKSTFEGKNVIVTDVRGIPSIVKLGVKGKVSLASNGVISIRGTGANEMMIQNDYRKVEIDKRFFTLIKGSIKISISL